MGAAHESIYNSVKGDVKSYSEFMPLHLNPKVSFSEKGSLRNCWTSGIVMWCLDQLPIGMYVQFG